MKTIDALNILGIADNQITYKILKSAYRRSSKAYHPDINKAGMVMMQAVNEAYETLKKQDFPIELDNLQEFTDYGDELNQALNKIIHLSGLEIEICSAWLWISGNTFNYRTIFKGAGFIWSSKKKMWYFRPETQSKKQFRGSTSIEKIREKYGSNKINFQHRAVLA